MTTALTETEAMASMRAKMPCIRQATPIPNILHTQGLAETEKSIFFLDHDTFIHLGLDLDRTGFLNL